MNNEIFLPSKVAHIRGITGFLVEQLYEQLAAKIVHLSWLKGVHIQNILLLENCLYTYTLIILHFGESNIMQ